MCDEMVWAPDELLGHGVVCFTSAASVLVESQGVGSEGLAWIDGVAMLPGEATVYLGGLRGVVTDDWFEAMKKYITSVRRGGGRHFWDRFGKGRRLAPPEQAEGQEQPDGPHFEPIPEKTYLIGWFFAIAPGQSFAEPVSSEEELRSYCRDAKVPFDPRWISEHPWYRPGMTEHFETSTAR